MFRTTGYCIISELVQPCSLVSMGLILTAICVGPIIEVWHAWDEICRQSRKNCWKIGNSNIYTWRKYIKFDYISRVLFLFGSYVEDKIC